MREYFGRQFVGVMEWAMKIATRNVLMLALTMGLTAAAYAQSANLGANGSIGLQAGGGHGAGMGLGTGLGTGLGIGAATPAPAPAPAMGTVGRSTAIGGTGGVGSGPALNNMRANGTSLNMSPNPRAPNVTGKAFGSQ
jgi:hypothetical protein